MNLHKVLALSWRDRALLLEAVAALTVTRAALLVVPFRKLVRRALRRSAPPLPGLGAAPTTGRADPGTAKRVGWALQVTAAHLPFGSSCLVRALAGKLMLDRRGVPCLVVLGVRAPGADFGAHAWLRAGELIVSGEAEAPDYSELARFA
jgi:hypothetical protein